MVTLVYAESVFAFDDYVRMNRLEGKVHYLADAHMLYHVGIDTEVIPVGNYAKRHDHGQVAEICLKRKIKFLG